MPKISQSYFHMGGNEPLRGETLPEFCASIFERFPSREAIVSIHQERRLSYRELASEVDRLARGLLGLGFGKGDRIGILSTNNIEWLTLQLATARIGALLVNINPAYRQQELAFVFQDTKLHALFCIPSFRSSDYVDILVRIIPELKDHQADQLQSRRFPLLRRVVLYNPTAPEQTTSPFPGFTPWGKVINAANNIHQADLVTVSDALDRDDSINIQYSSGTTGFPHPVVLSHHNLLNNAWFTARLLHFCEADRLCVPVPFYHCFGMVLCNLLCLTTGACIVLPGEYFNSLETLQAIEKEQCTAVHGVPTMFVAELEHPDFKSHDLSSLRTGIMGGAPCPPKLVKRVMEEMHCPDLRIGYGMTQASPLTHLTRDGDSLELRTRSVGINLPHQEVKVVDTEKGRTVPVGETGDICMRGHHIMKGYYNNPEATQAAVDENGWLHSADLGYMNENGYIHITGRIKDIIIRGGENIYPKEVEDFIFTHPKVAEVAVFGIPDDYFGEEIMAWIKLHTGKTATAEEIRSFCQGKIAHFKIPRHIRFVDRFPMTASGKLQKFRMKKIAIRQLEKEEEEKS